VSVDISKLDRALEAALLFLGKGADEATHRLSEILVEEVSLVDRAANKRHFLIVKRGGAMADEAQKDGGASVGPTAKQGELTIPTPVKEGLMRIVTEATERLVSVGNEVRGAQESAEQSAEPVPAELATEIKTISDLLRGALSRYPSPMSTEATEGAAPTEKADGPVSQALRAVGETAVSLATRAAEMDALDGPTLAAVRNLAAQLNALTEKYPQPTAGAVPSGAVEMEKDIGMEKAPEGVAAPPAGVDAAPTAEATMDTKLSSVGSEAGDKLVVIAQAITRIADASSPEELASIRDQMVGVGKSLEGLSESEMDEVTKAVGPSKLLRVLAALRPVFAMLEQGGDAPAPAEPPAATPDPATDTEKRAAENQPQSPARAGGDLDNVGTGPTADKAVKDGPTSDPLTDITKRLEKLETLAKAPEVPASRTENPPTQGKGDGTNRSRSGRRGGPWIM